MRLCLGSVEHDLTTHTLVMGVLHRSPASTVDLGALLDRADELVGEGADLLDVGGVGSGSEIDEEEELERLVRVVEALRARFDVPLSVDTSRARVLEACCAVGALVGNDVSGFADEAYLPIATKTGVTVVVTHTRPQAAIDLVGEVRDFLEGRVERARAAGVPDERIIVDAGLDLGKSPAQSLTLLRESAAVADLGLPLLLSASNKRFLGILLGLDVDERRMASHAAEALGIARGCRLVRAHDVRGARRVADVLEALLSARLVQVGRAGAEGEGDG